jgi:hypothetical protein
MEGLQHAELAHGQPVAGQWTIYVSGNAICGSLQGHEALQFRRYLSCSFAWFHGKRLMLEDLLGSSNKFHGVVNENQRICPEVQSEKEVRALAALAMDRFHIAINRFVRDNKKCNFPR